MKKIPAIFFALFLFIHSAQAQKCPTVRVSSADLIKAGETATFTAMVSGGDANVTPTYNWMVSAGSIESGQGTSTIVVNSTGLGGQTITATVDIGGFERECATSNSSTISVEEPAKEAELLVSGTYVTTKAFAAEVNKFANEILTAYNVVQAPQAVIYLYPGKNAAAATAIKEMTKTLKAVFLQKGMKSTMYRITVAGKRPKTAYEMWSVPESAMAPLPNPLL